MKIVLKRDLEQSALQPKFAPLYRGKFYFKPAIDTVFSQNKIFTFYLDDSRIFYEVIKLNLINFFI